MHIASTADARLTVIEDSARVLRTFHALPPNVISTLTLVTIRTIFTRRCSCSSFRDIQQRMSTERNLSVAHCTSDHTRKGSCVRYIVLAMIICVYCAFYAFNYLTSLTNRLAVCYFFRHSPMKPYIIRKSMHVPLLPAAPSFLTIVSTEVVFL